MCLISRKKNLGSRWRHTGKRKKWEGLRSKEQSANDRVREGGGGGCSVSALGQSTCCFSCAWEMASPCSHATVTPSVALTSIRSGMSCLGCPQSPEQQRHCLSDHRCHVSTSHVLSFTSKQCRIFQCDILGIHYMKTAPQNLTPKEISKSQQVCLVRLAFQCFAVL